MIIFASVQAAEAEGFHKWDPPAPHNDFYWVVRAKVGGALQCALAIPEKEAKEMRSFAERHGCIC